ncbi:triose-phosphate isomerase [Candidatus Falkowbacteria bacterium RIFOXYB2_FULL_34_18]|uniref:Triosephosphate isomerase n=1 Tax=Candidatus Falkowbacteria bacterium RIFOXYD2_FULL_34_120 TaxID=1798007 RepID=A0A1F5TMV7_9BACT|nr:MAG: triose-phosphate isomerase [Candidatus Falkowbacteria bacterium RIFOXYB2_FULL_34_18]OGF28515.1 MAG: triose-phosphate isomerase [Candidatus Falkowbacteria bacterium RIFOXYC12_FULL_34_55]OGF38148.1 MAG: triose-phosphate isomerase [Candidatus Falkowbacteria bacterium RIFOXYC2_FULL_34_220]OGF38533.1 MAG: triose-phosphate isomerase [Candidatus Falkowbacteria bacterium RIFOXYD12_FULL_34_57]OGF40216.1 MAG: triose-phosphate isomerase [Candidatus Falkowbacteria bacterium RIFOXYD2_FULL_34_120]
MKEEKIIIANWKMKLSLAETINLTKKIKTKFKDVSGVEIAIAPNFISLLEVGAVLKGTNIKLCAQDVFWEDLGAYTGEVSPSMLVEAGCQYVIIGHSERRKFMMENYEMIHREAKAVLGVENLTPVVCIGENWDERKTDRRDFVLYDQLQQALSGLDIMGNQEIIVAYEPIWAIGSGTAIEPTEAEYAHKIIKLTLNDMFGMKIVNNNFKIIYGGSINTKNAKGFIDLDNLDGMLVGGASLDVDEFYKLIKVITK